MAQLMEPTNLYAADFDRLVGRLDGAWSHFADARRAAFDRFNELGFPTTKHEEWRFTNLQPIVKTAFVPAEPGAPVTADTIDHLAFAAIGGCRIVFVDGFYRSDLSNLADLPAGMRVLSLGEAADDALVCDHLGRYAATDDSLTAMNTAFAADGVVVHVEKNVNVEQPIHVVYYSTAGDRPQVTHPRNLIVVETGGSATVIEHYASDETGDIFSNAVTEAVIADNAQLHHYLLEREHEQAFNVATLRVQQGRDSRLESHSILLGGGLVRNNIHVEMTGEGAHGLINGLYLPHGDQHMDNHMRVVHAAPHCDSRQYYKGILDGSSSGVFTGRIVVNEGAQKTDAVQSNTNLLLSNSARIDTKPQLEIYADDVKCTHGATTGQIDEKALFYLRSRGLSESAARGLLIYAFAHESIDRMKLESVRGIIEKLLVHRLPQIELLEGLL